MFPSIYEAVKEKSGEINSKALRNTCGRQNPKQAYLHYNALRIKKFSVVRKSMVVHPWLNKEREKPETDKL